jgi:hypothetical protein
MWPIVLLTSLFLIFQIRKDFVPLEEYEVFKKLDKYPINEYKIYAGNYWTVWPSVTIGQLRGVQIYGLSLRAEGYKDEISKGITQIAKPDGSFSVLCLEATVSDCSNQIKYLLGEILILDIKLISNDSFSLLVKKI